MFTEDLDLVGISDIAGIAGVSKSAVVNWRNRQVEFPAPRSDTKSGPLFVRSEVLNWLATYRSVEVSEPVEATLWAAADKLRGALDTSQFRRIVLTVLFLRGYLQRDEEGSAPTWDEILRHRDTDLAERLDTTLVQLSRIDPQLRGIRPMFVEAAIDPRRLADLVSILDSLAISGGAGGKDSLGRAYEYFLGRFASADGRSGGEYYTPDSVVSLLVELIDPSGSGVVYDPCCGSGGMFVQSARFVAVHKGSPQKLRIFGQELNPTTWQLLKMNLALHGLVADVGDGPADTFHDDVFPEMEADYVLANPPFNISDWGGELLREDDRWRHGVPPASNANMAWIEHMVSKLSKQGRAAIVLANGALTSDQAAEAAIRRSLVEADLVEAMVALPAQMFYSTSIPVTIWVLNRAKRRPQEVLFLDARALGEKVTRTLRVLTSDEVEHLGALVRDWREGGEVADSSLGRTVTAVEIAAAGYSLAPSRYVVTELASEVESLADLASEYKALVNEQEALDQQILRLLSALAAA